jgi:hypothetical protein
MKVIASIGKGVAAGIAGTAVMTVYQLAVAKLRGQPLATPVPHAWSEAPPPAQIAKKAAIALGRGNRITREDAPRVANVMHWLYGTAWGAFYGAVARSAGPTPLAGGVAFGTGVWGAAYAELVPLGIYEPPWRYPAKELALDLSYHLVYGVAVAIAYAALER